MFSDCHLLAEYGYSHAKFVFSCVQWALLNDRSIKACFFLVAVRIATNVQIVNQLQIALYTFYLLLKIFLGSFWYFAHSHIADIHLSSCLNIFDMLKSEKPVPSSCYILINILNCLCSISSHFCAAISWFPIKLWWYFTSCFIVPYIHSPSGSWMCCEIDRTRSPSCYELP